MKLKHRVPAAVGAAVLGTVALVAGVPSPAAAASSSCTAGFWYSPPSRTCTTGSIGPSSSGRIYIYVTACSGSPWKVWDTGTGKTVASGTGKGQSNPIETGVGGLVGTYRAKLTDACYRDYLKISN